MKKTAAFLLAISMLLCFAGCKKNDETNKNESSVPSVSSEPSSDTQDTPSETTSDSTKGEETNTKENISADIEVMLDFVEEAKEQYDRANNLVVEFNDGKITTEDLINKCKDEQETLKKFISKVNSTEWKSARYENDRG